MLVRAPSFYRFPSKTYINPAVTIGAITQVRVLGGVIGIAIAQAVLNALVLDDLTKILGQEKLDALLRSATEINNFTAAEAAATRQIYGRAFRLQNRIMTYFAAASLLAGLIAFKRHPLEYEDLDKVQNVDSRSST